MEPVYAGAKDEYGNSLALVLSGGATVEVAEGRLFKTFLAFFSPFSVPSRSRDRDQEALRARRAPRPPGSFVSVEGEGAVLDKLRCFNNLLSASHSVFLARSRSRLPPMNATCVETPSPSDSFAFCLVTASILCFSFFSSIRSILRTGREFFETGPLSLSLALEFPAGAGLESRCFRLTVGG